METAVLPELMRRALRRLALGCLFALLGACATDGHWLEPLPASSLDEAYRIDISQIDVVYEVDPAAETLRGRSTLRFRMRAGQSLPLFHFDPWTPRGRGRADSLRRVVLDGEEIPLEQLRVRRVRGSRQQVFEIPRALGDGEHLLAFEWSLWNWFRHDEPGWFRTVVDDTSGQGNEVLWPTINSPGELARHTLELRIDSDRRYSAVGSAGVRRSVEDGVQVFRLDTGREVASYTVMLCALPSVEVRERVFDAGAVPVRLLSTVDEATTALAVAVTQARLATLAADFGPLAQPSVDILLIDWDTGMEYFGATTTGFAALPHELTHLYWGTAVVSSTWRDSWLDEAINVWWNYNSSAVEPGFRSDLLSGEHSLALGFDLRAYEEGARVIGAVAAEIGVARLVDFLAGVYRERQFRPMSTEDFVADLIAYTGDSRWRERFARWVGEPRWAANPLGAVPLP